MLTFPEPIMQDFRVPKSDVPTHDFLTDNFNAKCSGLNELTLKPNPEAEKEKNWDQLPH